MYCESFCCTIVWLQPHTLYFPFLMLFSYICLLIHVHSGLFFPLMEALEKHLVDLSTLPPSEREGKAVFLLSTQFSITCIYVEYLLEELIWYVTAVTDGYIYDSGLCRVLYILD